MGSFFEWFKETKLVKGTVYAVVGMFSYPGLNMVNKLSISGMEHLENLPNRNVLFVSNHQTYFADVITFLHIFCARKWRKKNRLGLPYYLLWPFTHVKFVAAEETMKNNCTEVRRNLDPKDTRNITRALEKNWVITFPQGTTKPFAPGRKGTAFIIKNSRPVVIPVIISGYWRAFNKKGLKFKKKGSLLSVTFKPPMEIDYNDTNENILEKVMDAIEQSKKFMLKGKHHLMTVLDK
jgi:1-acyl-sn-glycerol-3-phosphate acyltransferase